ncbi:uncharacterized protein LOC128222064 isoform X2 [Mya arenaria]|nr:uncharacterized protein LOC128222064 isoform X2 [Mya arenaria]
MSLTSSIFGLAGVLLAPVTGGGSFLLSLAASGYGVASIAQSYVSEKDFKVLVEKELEIANKAIEEDCRETGHLLDIVQPLLNIIDVLPIQRMEQILQTVFKVSISEFVSRIDILQSPYIAVPKTVLTLVGTWHACATSSNVVRKISTQTLVTKSSTAVISKSGTAIVSKKSFKFAQKQTVVVSKGISKFGVACNLITVPLDVYGIVEASNRGKSELEYELRKTAKHLQNEVTSIEDIISRTPDIYEKLEELKTAYFKSLQSDERFFARKHDFEEHLNDFARNTQYVYK